MCALSLVAKRAEFRSRRDADGARRINVFGRILNALVLNTEKADLCGRDWVVPVILRRILKRNRIGSSVNPVSLQGKRASAGLPPGKNSGARCSEISKEEREQRTAPKPSL